MKTPKNNEVTEKYKCQSYYDDDNILRDCTCGKCEGEEWELQLNALPHSQAVVNPNPLSLGDVMVSRDRVRNLIHTLLSQTIAEERERMVAIGEELLDDDKLRYDTEDDVEYRTYRAGTALDLNHSHISGIADKVKSKVISAYQQKIKSLDS